MSSEALERAERIRENISHVARGCRSASSHNPAPYLNSIEAALVALLAEIATLEQERDEAIAQSLQDVIDRTTAIKRRQAAEAELAVAREREQRLREALVALLNVQPYFEVLSPTYAHWDERRERAFDLVASALVDEPATTRDDVGAVCDAFLEWMESVGYNSIDAADIVASCRAAADEPGETP